MGVIGGDFISLIRNDYIQSESERTIFKIPRQDSSISDNSPVRVSISEEGAAEYRKSLAAISNSMEADLDLERMEKMRYIREHFRMDGVLQGEYHRRWKELNNKHSSAGDLAYHHLTVYTEMYDEIVKGYQEGTREYWRQDNDSEYGFRKMTMEEEIAELDRAADFITMLIDDHVNHTPKMRELSNKIWNETQAKLRQCGVAVGPPVTVSPYQKPKEDTEGIDMKLKSAVRDIKKNYQFYSGSLHMLVNSAFHGNINLQLTRKEE